MSRVIKFCPQCREENVHPLYGYYPFMSEDAACKKHKIKMETINLTEEEYLIITNVSFQDITVMDEMVRLKNEDPRTFQTRLMQYDELLRIEQH